MIEQYLSPEHAQKFKIFQLNVVNFIALMGMVFFFGHQNMIDYPIFTLLYGGCMIALYGGFSLVQWTNKLTRRGSYTFEFAGLLVGLFILRMNPELTHMGLLAQKIFFFAFCAAVLVGMYIDYSNHLKNKRSFIR